MTKVCAFDSNGTLFDMRALNPFFVKTFGRSEYREIWFHSVLHASLVLNAVGDYHELSTLATESLSILADEHDVKVGLAAKAELMKEMQSLPIFPDVREGLEMLKNAGYRLVIFSNASKASSKLLLVQAGIQDLFDEVLSTDSAKSFKPSQKSYEVAAKELGVPIKDIWLIAGHAWDTGGAKVAGAKSALIKRPGYAPLGVYPSSTVVADDLLKTAVALIAKDKTFVEKIRELV